MYNSENMIPRQASLLPALNDILEAFDASQLDSTDLESADNWANAKGSQFLRWDGWDYGDGNPDGDIANDPCTWDINVTNSDGLLMLGDNEENATNKVAHTDVLWRPPGSRYRGKWRSGSGC